MISKSARLRVSSGHAVNVGGGGEHEGDHATELKSTLLLESFLNSIFPLSVRRS